MGVWCPQEQGRCEWVSIADIGRTRDLMSIEFFELGLLAAECVGRVVTMGQANGTGFLVAPGLIMTNEHVLSSVDEAAASEIELNFEVNRIGTPKRVQALRLLPQRFFLASKELDFALVAAEAEPTAGAQLNSFKFLPLIGEEGKARIGEALNIIQHPDGRAEEVVIRNNQLLDLPEGPERRDQNQRRAPAAGPAARNRAGQIEYVRHPVRKDETGEPDQQVQDQIEAEHAPVQGPTLVDPRSIPADGERVRPPHVIGGRGTSGRLRTTRTRLVRHCGGDDRDHDGGRPAIPFVEVVRQAWNRHERVVDEEKQHAVLGGGEFGRGLVDPPQHDG